MSGPAQTPPPPLSWQALRAARRDVGARFPSPFRLPLERRPTDVLYARLGPHDALLDVGAGDATRRERVAQRFPGVRYTSVDPDPEAAADHADLGRVAGPFDVATLLEVLEHVRPETAIATLERTRELLRPGGVVVVSVPCTHTPGRFQRDCTHVTPWAHDELGAALVLAGFRLESLHRTYPAPWVQRVLRRALLGPLGHLFGLDYAYSVVAVGIRD